MERAKQGTQPTNVVEDRRSEINDIKIFRWIGWNASVWLAGEQLDQCEMQSNVNVGRSGITRLSRCRRMQTLQYYYHDPGQTPSTFPSEELWFSESVASLRLPPNRPNSPKKLPNIEIRVNASDLRDWDSN